MFDKKGNFTWTAKSIYNSVKNEKINLKHYIQRSFVWDINRKHELIRSMLEGYPIGIITTRRNEDGSHCVVDGVQRCSTIQQFIDDEFAIDNIYKIELDNGKLIDVNGMRFSNLPSELQDRIRDYNITIYYYDNLSDEKFEELFFRINNGKQLATIYPIMARAESAEQVRELAKHSVFNFACTNKAMEKKAHYDLVIKSFIMLRDKERAFSSGHIREYMEYNEITKEDMKVLTEIFGKIQSVYNAINSDGQKALAKKVLRKTHFLSLIPLAKEVSGQELLEFVLRFYSTDDKSASINEEYNEACQQGSGKNENIELRVNILFDEYGITADKEQHEELDTITDEEIEANSFKEEDLYKEDLYPDLDDILGEETEEEIQGMLDEIDSPFGDYGLDNLEGVI